MQDIKTISAWPNGAAVNAVQGKITKVFQLRNFGGKNVQDAELSDAAGNSIPIVAWGQSDLKFYEGKEVVIHAGAKGGLKIVHDSYVAKKDSRNHKAGDTVNTIKLSVPLSAGWQLVEVYKAQNPNGGAVPVLVPNAPETQGKGLCVASQPTTSIHGATVGMAINQACANLTHQGLELEPDAIHRIASGIVRVALRMERGELAQEGAKEEVPY